MKKQICFLFSIVVLLMFASAGAAEEQPWCGEEQQYFTAYEEKGATTRGGDPVSCTAYADQAKASCNAYYIVELTLLCNENAAAICNNYANNTLPPDCAFYYGGGLCHQQYNQLYQQCISLFIPFCIQQGFPVCNMVWDMAFNECMYGSQ